jgi:hypothetical protein
MSSEAGLPHAQVMELSIGAALLLLGVVWVLVAVVAVTLALHADTVLQRIRLWRKGAQLRRNEERQRGGS